MTFPGSAHDMNHFRSTKLWHKFVGGNFPAGFFLIGDAAYTCKDWLLSPYIGKQVHGSMEDSFNWALSSLRINIECAFGELIRRWGVLWRKLEVHHTRRAALILCCAHLHNFCIDRRIRMDDLQIEDEGRYEPHTGVWQGPPEIDDKGRPIYALKAGDARDTGESEYGGLRGRKAREVQDSGVRRADS